MALYVAFLRSLYLINQHSHWTIKGDSFYGDHLLLQRLYESAQDNADHAAEKTIGLYGHNALPAMEQAEHIHKILSRYTLPEPLSNSIEAEKDFLSLSKKIYNMLKQNDALTLGMDDMIMSIASDREEALYLLNQTVNQ
jgi:DNA-binding ferritin-like protein